MRKPSRKPKEARTDVLAWDGYDDSPKQSEAIQGPSNETEALLWKALCIMEPKDVFRLLIFLPDLARDCRNHGDEENARLADAEFRLVKRFIKKAAGIANASEAAEDDSQNRASL